ncbi:hypothetical protein FPRO03_14291 [Fusarium proliferatum]|nr:hypothetical protein FPRO03_14291 [Fusarium proliferatum]
MDLLGSLPPSGGRLKRRLHLSMRSLLLRPRKGPSSPIRPPPLTLPRLLNSNQSPLLKQPLSSHATVRRSTMPS